MKKPAFTVALLLGLAGTNAGTAPADLLAGFSAEAGRSADAAHELRTPIAAIRTQAQVALAEPDAELRRHALQATLLGCDRATRLVDQLLTLARLEGGERPPCNAGKT